MLKREAPAMRGKLTPKEHVNLPNAGDRVLFEKKQPFNTDKYEEKLVK